ncbi:MAG: UvrD-helicase domain-containing protein [Acidobacteria bacterium]|nr:UvrD-helicase domain-containing protein [Acidobacteriota bacterium]
MSGRFEPTLKQKDAIESSSKLICVTASAGTGKTTILIERILRQMEEQNLDPSRIMALTFSNNAARQMKIRLREGVLSRFSSSTGDSRDFWWKAYRRLDSMQVKTLHSFCADFLRQNALMVGLDPMFEISDGVGFFESVKDEEFRLALSEIKNSDNYLLTRLTSHISPSWLRDKVYEIYLTRRDKIFELSDAVDDLSDIIPSNEFIKNYLDNLSTTTVKDFSWKQLMLKGRKFSVQLASMKITDESVSKYQANLLDQFTQLENIATECKRSPIPLADYVELVKRATIKPRSIDRSIPSCPVLGDLLGVIKAIRELAVASGRIGDINGDTETYRAFCSDVFRFYKIFAERIDKVKKANSVTDFTDIIIETSRFIKENPDSLNDLHTGTDHLLVDEFQDTDGIQLDIISHICGLKGREASPARYPSLFIVGDEKQSIYRFRGADVTVSNRMRQIVKERGGDIIDLDVNFRSTENLTRFHNRLFSTFMEPESDIPYDVSYSESKPMRELYGSPAVEFILMNPEQRMVNIAEDEDSEVVDDKDPLIAAERTLKYGSFNEDKKNIDYYREMEARLIGRKIREIVDRKNYPIGDGEARHPADFKDIALLFNSLQNFHIYQKIFDEYDIPFRMVEIRDYYTAPEIVSALNLISSLADPSNEIALLGLIRSPLVGINDDTLTILLSEKKRSHLMEIILSHEFHGIKDQIQAGRLQRFAEGFSELLSHKDSGNLLDYISKVEEKFRIIDVFAATETGHERVLALDKLFNSIIPDLIGQGFDTMKALSVAMLNLASENKGVETLQAFDEEDGISNSVIVSTIHKAKGLEYPVVFIPNLMQQHNAGKSGVYVNPSAGLGFSIDLYDQDSGLLNKPEIPELNILKDIEKRQEFAEIKRLLYVAVTRAEDYLFISGLNQIKNNRFYLRLLETIIEASSNREDFAEEININFLDADRLDEIKHETPYGMRQDISHTELSVFDAELLETIPLSLKNKNRFIATELNDFARCPRYYYYSHIENIPHYQIYHPVSVNKKMPMNPAEFGSLVHKILEDYPLDLPPDEFFNLLNLPLEQRETVKKKTLELITGYHSSSLFTDLAKADEILREYTFIYRLGDVLIEGMIDLLFRNGETWTVVDFKTDNVDSKDVEKKALKYRTQMNIYALAASEFLNVGNNSIKTGFYFLTPSKSVERILSQKDRAEIKSELSIMVNKIKENTHWNKTDDCVNCPFDELC